MSSLFYINYNTRRNDYEVKKVMELSADGNAIIFGRFATKVEAENYIKKEDELELNNNHNENK